MVLGNPTYKCQEQLTLNAVASVPASSRRAATTSTDAFWAPTMSGVSDSLYLGRVVQGNGPKGSRLPPVDGC